MKSYKPRVRISRRAVTTGLIAGPLLPYVSRATYAAELARRRIRGDDSFQKIKLSHASL